MRTNTYAYAYARVIGKKFILHVLTEIYIDFVNTQEKEIYKEKNTLLYNQKKKLYVYECGGARAHAYTCMRARARATTILRVTRVYVHRPVCPPWGL